jgi:DNA gyrase subunit A
VNGSAGIAVGMATTSRRTTCARSPRGHLGLEHPDASREELQDASSSGSRARTSQRRADRRSRRIEQAYRTGRGSVTQRAVIEIDEDAKGRTCLSITELPYMVNPDNLALKIAELADSGKVRGSPTSVTTPPGGPASAVVVLKRDASRGGAQQPVEAHRAADQLQREHAGAGRRRPRPHSTSSSATGCPPDRGDPAATRFRLGGRAAAHVQRGLVKALDALDEVIA